jgi:aspartyl/glutamyl-tRNA(Asn/Gln) amidotransferase C subunit
MQEDMNIDEYVSDEELRKTAELAAIKLDPADYPVLRKSLQKILEHFALISKVNQDDSAAGTPVERMVRLEDARDDIARSGDGKVFIKNAPDFEDGFFFIPEILK